MLSKPGGAGRGSKGETCGAVALDFAAAPGKLAAFGSFSSSSLPSSWSSSLSSSFEEPEELDACNRVWVYRVWV